MPDGTRQHISDCYISAVNICLTMSVVSVIICLPVVPV